MSSRELPLHTWRTHAHHWVSPLRPISKIAGLLYAWVAIYVWLARVVHRAAHGEVASVNAPWRRLTRPSTVYGRSTRVMLLLLWVLLLRVLGVVLLLLLLVVLMLLRHWGRHLRAVGGPLRPYQLMDDFKERR